VIGATLHNRYRIDAELGRGGMSVVYRAHDTLLDRPVAVKVLSRVLSEVEGDSGLGTEGRARLLREAQAAARLDHPNIVSVYDVGFADETGDTPFIVMQLVTGATLRECGPLSTLQIVTIARQLCEALDHAHAQGIVHRDLKPENISVVGSGERLIAKLMDFGLARSHEASRLTQEDAVVGTVFYLAPEQALGQEVDGRADLYALGVILYELTTGRLPFTGSDPLLVISQHLHAPVVPPRVHNPAIPPELEALILRLLSKKPDDRPASAREVLDALTPAQAQSLLPSGNVTFLYTDIQGSSSLWERDPVGMRASLARHDAILHEIIAAHGGQVFKVIGDAFQAAFTDPVRAVSAALAGQRALAAATWGATGPLKVRMGLHWGVAEARGADYATTHTLNRVARVMSAGHGGQILLSLDVADQVREHLPEGVGLRDLSRHRLKGLSQAEQLFQIVAPDLPANFPPLKSTPVAPATRSEVFSLLDHIVRGQLIGRERELAELEGFWNRAERGEGHLVLLSGEPGVGKTRLAEELANYARLRGALILDGHFHPELGVTYLGIREALRDYVRSLPPEQARAAIGPTAPELVKLAPEVEAIVGSVTPNPPMGELEAERLRLFDHVAQFLLGLMEKSPILFILEDLHWADGPSLLFLHFLLRNTRKARLLVLGTYRETELEPVRPFYETLLGLNRDRLYTRVALRGLEAESVASLVSALLGGPVEAELVAAITRDTEGNPFFIEEVVKGLVERSGLRLEDGVWRPVGEVEHYIPQSIQIALGKRLEALSEDARAVLALAAVLGREFDVDVLLSIAEWDEDRLLDALDEATRAQLIAETRAHGKDEYRFAHALLAQVVYDGINTRRRARFHQQAGEALERVHARRLDDHVEALAYHYSRAPSSAADKAVTYGLRAAEKAAAVYAHDQAIRHYTEVLEALADLNDPAREAQAWELMGDAKMKLYYAREAIAAYERALAVLDAGGLADGQEHCRLSYKLGELIIREEKDPRRARGHLEHALASSAAPPDSPQRVKCLAALAICLVEEGSLPEALAQAQSAIELAERLGYTEGVASACGALCSIHEARGDWAAYARFSERQVAALDEGHDLYGIFDAYGHILNSSGNRGDYAQLERFALAGLELCRKFNAPGWEGTILANYLWLLNKQGRWEEALKHGERVLPLFERVGCSTCFMYVFWNLAEIEARRGHREQSRRYTDTTLDILMQLDLQRGPDPAATIRWRFFGHMLLEEWGAAWALVEESQAAGYPDFAMGTSLMFWRMMIAEAAARTRRWPEAERLAREGIALFQEFGLLLGVASSRLALGLAHAGQQQWNEALAEFEQALAAYQTLGHPWDIANTQYEMALAYSDRRQNDDLDQARRLLQQAHSTFKDLQAEPGMAKVALTLEQLG
jgi:class 3 adenylate cyclase/tetratricopeptide (TPR) repeat protein